MAAIQKQIEDPKITGDVRLAAEALLQKVAWKQNPALTLTADSLLAWDGNCWFSALLFFLRLQKRDNQKETGEPWNVKALRAQVYDYILKEHPCFFPMYYNADPAREGIDLRELFNTDNKYLRDSSNYSTTSNMGDFVPLAISMLFSMHITIVQHTGLVLTVGHDDHKHKMTVGRIELPTVQHVHALVLK